MPRHGAAGRGRTWLLQPALGRQMRAEAREEFTSRIHKLEVELAEMRGELKGLREAHRDNVVELPRSAWKSNAA